MSTWFLRLWFCGRVVTEGQGLSPDPFPQTSNTAALNRTWGLYLLSPTIVEIVKHYTVVHKVGGSIPIEAYLALTKLYSPPGCHIAWHDWATWHPIISPPKQANHKQPKIDKLEPAKY